MTIYECVWSDKGTVGKVHRTRTAHKGTAWMWCHYYRATNRRAAVREVTA